MNIVNPVSIYRVLQTTSEELINLNNGFIGDKTIGIFHMIGYEPNTMDYLMLKPINGQEVFMITNDYYNEHCKELLNFKLYNN